MTIAYGGHAGAHDFGLGDVCADCGITRAEAFGTSSEPYVSPHKNLDPITGDCQDCGAKREEIDDRIYATCEKAKGPHREAILALRRERRHLVLTIEQVRRESIQAERAAVEADRRCRNLEARAAELDRSMAALEIAEIVKPPKVPFGSALPE